MHEQKTILQTLLLTHQMNQWNEATTSLPVSFNKRAKTHSMVRRAVKSSDDVLDPSLVTLVKQEDSH